MKVAVLFDDGRRVDFDEPDILLLIRRYGHEFRYGSKTEVYGTGIWEHVTIEQIHDVLERLSNP